MWPGLGKSVTRAFWRSRPLPSHWVAAQSSEHKLRRTLASKWSACLRSRCSSAWAHRPARQPKDKPKFGHTTPVTAPRSQAELSHPAISLLMLVSNLARNLHGPLFRAFPVWLRSDGFARSADSAFGKPELEVRRMGGGKRYP